MKLNLMGLLVVLGMLFFTACSNPVEDQSRRGGGTEIPNGIQANIVVRLTDASGTPLRVASLQVIAGKSWGDRVLLGQQTVLHEVVTDSMGLVNVPVDESKVFLWAKNDTQGVYMALRPSDSLGVSRSNPLPVQARKLGAMFVRDAFGKPIGIFGTPYSIHRVAELADSLVHLPMGDYMPVRKNEFGLQLGQSFELTEFNKIYDVRNMIFSDSNNLMLTNFQNRRVHKIWDPLHVGGYWWVKSEAGGLLTWDHVGINQITDIIDSVGDNIFAGIDVQFTKTLPNTEQVGQIGLDFRAQPVNTNLSRATHIRFKAKGSGSWEYHLETVDTLGNNFMQWYKIINLTSEWQEFRIPMQDFYCENCGNAQFFQETRMGINMYWQTKVNASIYLDDLVIEGFEFMDWVDP